MFLAFIIYTCMRHNWMSLLRTYCECKIWGFLRGVHIYSCVLGYDPVSTGNYWYILLPQPSFGQYKIFQHYKRLDQKTFTRPIHERGTLACMVVMMQRLLLHCALSVSSIEILPLIYRYCKLALWTTYKIPMSGTTLQATDFQSLSWKTVTGAVMNLDCFCLCCYHQQLWEDVPSTNTLQQCKNDGPVCVWVNVCCTGFEKLVQSVCNLTWHSEQCCRFK